MLPPESSFGNSVVRDIPSGQAPRLQAGMIVWQQAQAGIQVLLIERKSGRGWGIPKGGIDAGENSNEAARREAWEEAGAEGEADTEVIGQMRYTKRGRPQIVELYSMRIQLLASQWPEASHRRRAWFSIEDAITELGRFSGLDQALKNFKRSAPFTLAA